jgi:hypothetical protein
VDKEDVTGSLLRRKGGGRRGRRRGYEGGWGVNKGGG